ncbi:unnamed protein product, partial [Prorocentrum cordatum]
MEAPRRGSESPAAAPAAATRRRETPLVERQALSGMVEQAQQLSALVELMAEEVKRADDRDLLNSFGDGEDPLAKDYQQMPAHMNPRVRQLVDDIKGAGRFPARSLRPCAASAASSPSRAGRSGTAGPLKGPMLFGKAPRQHFQWEPRAPHPGGGGGSPRPLSSKGAAHCVPLRLADSLASLPPLARTHSRWRGASASPPLRQSSKAPGRRPEAGSDLPEGQAPSEAPPPRPAAATVPPWRRPAAEGAPPRPPDEKAAGGAPAGGDSSFRRWLLEVDPRGSLERYLVFLEGRYDDLAQLIDVYFPGKPGEKVLNHQLFSDMGVVDSTHVALFEVWFARKNIEVPAPAVEAGDVKSRLPLGKAVGQIPGRHLFADGAGDGLLGWQRGVVLDHEELQGPAAGRRPRPRRPAPPRRPRRRAAAGGGRRAGGRGALCGQRRRGGQ